MLVLTYCFVIVVMAVFGAVPTVMKLFDKIVKRLKLANSFRIICGNSGNTGSRKTLKYFLTLKGFDLF